MKLTAPVHWSARLLIPAALLLGGLLFLRYIGKFQGLFEHGTDAAIAGGSVEARTHGPFVRRQRELADRAAAARAAAHRLAEDTAALRASRDSAVKLALDLATQLDSAHAAAVRRLVIGIVAACSAEQASCQRRADSLAVADSLAEVRATEAEARALHADSLVAPLTHAANCRWLGIGFMPKCLTRTQSFVAGGGLVALLKLVGIIK